ncbi:MAG TPA: non-homologous end-joining DNA ligase, partial [Polyangia bacterium]|nr:non-homologous end-joining DNA ligase [Polyangia bacterium]
FEGIIPKGEYGGGTVLLWDRGTWEPVGDPRAGYAAGNLKFHLKGHKLQGGFALIKLKGRPRGPGGRGSDDRSWLLIKERDAAAKPEGELSITTARPESVTTRRDLDDVAADRSRVWHSNRGQVDLKAVAGAAAAAHPLPRAFRPAVARVANEVPEGDDWLHEMEIEGDRLLGAIDGQEVRALGPDGRAVAAARAQALAPFTDGLRMLPAQKALVDGVLTILRPDGGTTREGIDEALGSGGDEAAGALTYFAFDLLHLDGYDLRGATLEDRKQLLHRLVSAAAPEAPLLRLAAHISGGGAAFYAEACKVGMPAVVSKRRDHRYTGRARARQWLVTRCPAPAKTPEAPVPGPMPRPPPRAPTAKAGKTAGAAAGVRLSTPLRVLWGDLGFTKQDLAAYYAAVAERALPHVAGRPLTLFRCPEGVGVAGAQPCFYMKHATFSVPGNVARIKLKERAEANEYLYVTDESGLMALVQMSILEIHTWGSQAADVERPDRIVIDLDPDPTVKWEDVVVAAHLVRHQLQAIHLESFVKTTGGKGLHVVAPLLPDLGWEEITALSRAVAEQIARGAPRSFTTNMAKAVRPGRILLDYMRNHRGSTAVAAFSTRARAGATVSMPIAWDDLVPDLDPARFNVRTVPEILRAEPSDPWARYFRLRQTISPEARRLISAPP